MIIFGDIFLGLPYWLTAIVLSLDTTLYMYVNAISIYVSDILGDEKKWTTIYRFLMKYLAQMLIIMYRFVVSCISISLLKSIVRISNKCLLFI